MSGAMQSWSDAELLPSERAVDAVAFLGRAVAWSGSAVGPQAVLLDNGPRTSLTLLA